MMIVRIRVYSGGGQPVGDLEVPVANAQVWLDQQESQDSDALVDIRGIVDPDHQMGYNWNVRAKPREVREDLGIEDPGGLMQIE